MPKFIDDPDDVDGTGKPLVVGGFYWVWIVLDPDVADGDEWMNEPMPARYDGDHKWRTLGCVDNDWPVRLIGDRIMEKEIKHASRSD